MGCIVLNVLQENLSCLKDNRISLVYYENDPPRRRQNSRNAYLLLPTQPPPTPPPPPLPRPSALIVLAISA